MCMIANTSGMIAAYTQLWNVIRLPAAHWFTPQHTRCRSAWSTEGLFIVPTSAHTTEKPSEEN